MRDIAIVGNVNLDVLVSPASELPPPGVERVVDAAGVRPGGAAANASLALAALGTPPRLAGCVGDDGVGRLLVDELARGGISHGVAVVPGTPTGVSVALEAPGRDRSFLTALGSLATFDRSMIAPDVLSADLVLLCGYFLLPSLQGEASRDLLGEVRSRGGTTLFDCGWDPGGWPPAAREGVLDLLPLVDVFLPNEAEAAELTGVSEPLEAARALRAASGGWTVVKLGDSGCLAVGPDGSELAVPAPNVRVLDTTGAGDTFNAGLLHALAQGDGWPDALRFATRVASTAVSRPSGDRYPRIADLA
jgi:argininosuccinate lyase